MSSSPRTGPDTQPLDTAANADDYNPPKAIKRGQGASKHIAENKKMQTRALGNICTIHTSDGSQKHPDAMKKSDKKRICAMIPFV